MITENRAAGAIPKLSSERGIKTVLKKGDRFIF